MAPTVSSAGPPAGGTSGEGTAGAWPPTLPAGPARRLAALYGAGAYAFELLLALDRLGNAVLGGRSLDTISARAGFALDRSEAARALCDLLDYLDADHCIDAAELPAGVAEDFRARFALWRSLRDPGPTREALRPEAG